MKCSEMYCVKEVYIEFLFMEVVILSGMSYFLKFYKLIRCKLVCLLNSFDVFASGVEMNVFKFFFGLVYVKELFLFCFCM